MRLLTLTIIAAVTFACSASAQVPYSDGGLILKRRPFAPGGQFTPPPPILPGWEPPHPYAYPPPVRWPIYSPYSMIHWDWLPKTRPPEALPAPVPPGARPPMPPPKPAGPPATPPTRPTFLPSEGQE